MRVRNEAIDGRTALEPLTLKAVMLEPLMQRRFVLPTTLEYG
jgi:hypothetical protein